MSEEIYEPEKPESGLRLTHELKFYIAVLVGVLSSPFLLTITTAQEAANQITVRRPPILGAVYVLLVCYAAGEYIRFLRTDERTIIPPAIRGCLTACFFLLAFHATHFCGAVVSVDQQTFVAFDPILSLLGNSSYDLAGLEQIALARNSKGREVLIVTAKGAAKSESISCDILVRQVLPKLSAAAKANGVIVVGF